MGDHAEVLSDDGSRTPSIDGVVAGGIKPSGGESFGGTSVLGGSGYLGTGYM